MSAFVCPGFERRRAHNPNVRNGHSRTSSGTANDTGAGYTAVARLSEPKGLVDKLPREIQGARIPTPPVAKIRGDAAMEGLNPA